MRRRVTVIALFVSVLAAGTAAAVKRAEQSVPRSNRIAVSGASIVNRSVPLCRLIDPDADSLSIEPFASNPDNPRFWYVKCDDAAGNERIRMDWDARSGALLQVSSVGDYLQPSRSPLLSPDDIRHAAHRWLTEIAPRPGSGWHVDRILIGYNKFVWHAYASAGRMRGHVAIQSHTGKLLMLQAYQPHHRLPIRSRRDMRTPIES